MDKRYQVFISSTFRDLQEARNAVLQSLLRMRHIPAGMELFPAIDEEQMRYIEKVIDESDYYILIIGGRYGSMSNGISFTEKEYDYAVKMGKPVLAFIYDNPEDLPAKHTEKDPELQKKLQDFCEKVKTGGRIVRFWHDIKDLRAEVAESLPQTITARPAVGWVRGDKVTSETMTVEQNALLKERDSLKAENQKLKEKLGQNTDIPDIAGLDEVLPAHFVENMLVPADNSWRSLFVAIALKMNMLVKYAREFEIQENFPFHDAVLQIVRVQFEELGLIKIDSDGDWNLTDKGKRTVKEAIVVRRPDSGSVTR